MYILLYNLQWHDILFMLYKIIHIKNPTTIQRGALDWRRVSNFGLAPPTVLNFTIVRNCVI